MSVWRGDKRQFGDSTNYSIFENDGTLVFYGDATVWDDLRFPISAVRRVSGREPAEVAYKGGLVYGFSDSADNSITFNAQTPHSYKLGTNLDFHIHYVLPTAGAGGGVENIKFDFTYSWANINGVFNAETTVSKTLDVQALGADTHFLLDIGDVLESNATGTDGVSGMLICSLTRDTTVANNYADDVYLLEADFHYEIDTVGSRQEYIK